MSRGRGQSLPRPLAIGAVALVAFGCEVSEADAPCVADAILAELTEADLDVLLSGEITEEFLARFISAMEVCGAINS